MGTLRYVIDEAIVCGLNSDLESRISRRYPHQVGKEVSKGINAGRIEFADKHLSSKHIVF
jgi:acyl-CoA hydrolase